MDTSLNYSNLGFTIHRKCNASCKHCCMSSNPKCKEKLNLKRVKEYIDESRSISKIKTISFTGGEPFLEYDSLLSLIKHSKNAGKNVSCVSNGFWAKDKNTVEKTLYELKECGLDKLNISHDNYHNEFINTEYIKNILYASGKCEIKCSLSIVKSKNEEVGNLINALDSALYYADVHIAPCLPSGNCKNNLQDNQYDRTIPGNNLKCLYGGNINVSYDGMIYPCCSPSVFETSLSVGNFNDISLEQALKNIKNNAILYILRNYSMDTLSGFVEKELKLKNDRNYVNSCELCSYIFKEEYFDALSPYINKIIASKLT